MIIEKIKIRIKEVMKQKLAVERDLLRLIVSIAQQADNYSDDSLIKIITKIIKSNNETIKAMNNSDYYSNYADELTIQNEILLGYLPQSFSEQEIFDIIKFTNIDLKACSGDGQAIGLVVKTLKADGSKSIDNALVRKVILEIRT
jgi:uncharacterized protein YqeY